MWVKTKNYLWIVVVIENEPFLIYPDGWLPVDNFPQLCSYDSTFNALEVYKYNLDAAGGMQYNVWKNKLLIEDSYFTKIWSASKRNLSKW